ncbi:hypothetical protein ACCY16_08500 [Candidatus Pantoea formicae]|uniref:hypothetical protein n=1 Tax=Candidatus Pantoea formicae TaxID=2608355 RepID=UPI003EDB3F2F
MPYKHYAKEIESACGALRWAAFGSAGRGLAFSSRQVKDNRWHFETEYGGRKAWVDLELPCTPLSALLGGALLLQQLNGLAGEQR